MILEFKGHKNSDKMKIQLYLFCLSSILMAACANEKDISEYYFPIKALKQEGKVYEYHFVGRPEVMPEYWYHQTLSPDPKASDKRGDYFTSTLYDINLDIQQIVSEEVVSNGMLLDELFLFFKDSTGRTEKVTPTVVLRNVYPFEYQDTITKYHYKIYYQDPFKTYEKNYLTRSRRYKGKTQYAYKGKNYDCIEFEVIDKIDNEQEGHLETYIYGKEIYAKGIGLIYYKKGLNKQLALEYELADIYPMSELEKKLR
jgi:hypothetical protein